MYFSRKLLALSLFGALLLTGCGGQADAGTSSATGPAQGGDSLFQMTVAGESVTLEPNQRYISWNTTEPGTECFDLNTEAVTQSWEGQTLTTGDGVGMGATIAEVMDAYHIQPNYASLYYEYTAGEDIAEVGELAYTGTLPDWEQERILDLCLSVAYARQGGQWQQLDLSQQHYSDYDGPKVVYNFDFTEAQEGDAESVALSELTISYYTP